VRVTWRGVRSALAAAGRSAGARLGPLLPDGRAVHVYGGGALVAWGAWQAWPPAGWVTAGLVLLYLGLRRT
jgi:hypothetical protein